MSEKKGPIFKCPNDLKVNVTKSNGEVVIDEECCTAVSVILKNTGEIASSFFGAHNPEVVKILDKTFKMYFKSIKKTLRQEFKAPKPDEITIVDKDLPEADKWNGEEVPDLSEKSAQTKKATKKSVTKKKK